MRKSCAAKSAKKLKEPSKTRSHSDADEMSNQNKQQSKPSTSFLRLSESSDDSVGPQPVPPPFSRAHFDEDDDVQDEEVRDFPPNVEETGGEEVDGNQGKVRGVHSSSGGSDSYWLGWRFKG